MTLPLSTRAPGARHRIWIAAAALCCLGARGGLTADAGRERGDGRPSGQILVGNTLFRSAHNGSRNPAVDTVAVGSTVTWIWTKTGNIPHNVQSEATPSFPSSDILTGAGKQYSVTFATPGTYQYDCVVHGAAMRGTIVVR
jgi:plastocyanin